MPGTAEEKAAADKAAADKVVADKAAAEKAAGSEKPPTYDQWFEAQDETTKGLITGHTTGLKSALDAERGTRKDLESKLREAASNAEDGSEQKKQLEAAAKLAETATAQIEFQLAAHAEGVTNLQLAWLAVSEDDSLRDRRGVVNFEALKTKHPELFADSAIPPRGDAGAGADAQQKPGGGMNDFIRARAGARR